MTSRVAHVARAALSQALSAVRSFVVRRRRLAIPLETLVARFPHVHDAILELAGGDSDVRYRRWIAEYDTLGSADLAAMRSEASRFAVPPLLSVLVETADEPLARSLSEQVYARWELLRTRSQSAEAWNRALESAESDHVVIVGRGVVLRPHALFLLARTLDRHPSASLIYADEDVIDEAGGRHDHYFKPEWNETLLRSQNYLGGLVCVRRSLALDVGGCRERLEGEYAWGLFLRIGEAAPRQTIHHLPFVLSHRRANKSSSTSCPADRQRVARALEQRLVELGQDGSVEPIGRRSYRAHYRLPDEPPPVSVVVPTTARLDLLPSCLDGLLKRTTYPRLEILVVVNGKDAANTAQRDYLDAVAAQPDVRILFHDDGTFNFSRTSNWAVEQANGEIVCFLNDDTAVINGDWLAEMVNRVLQEGVAVVGAMLFFPNRRIQHAGIVLGVGYVAGHTYVHRRIGIGGYHDRALVDQDVSAVSAACMVVRRDTFRDVGGFDESLAIAFNDIDLCLRLRDAGWRTVWTPSAQLYHRESATLVRHDSDPRGAEWRREIDVMLSRWGSQLCADPHYNLNLSLDRFQMWQPAFPPRVIYPWRLTAPSAHRDTEHASPQR